MRILHVVSGLQKASGVTTFVENLVRELRAVGHIGELVYVPTALFAYQLGMEGEFK